MKHYLVKVFKNKENWCFQSWLIHLIVVNLSNCISVSLFKGKILVSDNTIFEVLVVKQTCIIVIIKMAKWKVQKSKHCFTQERSWHFINNRFSYLGMLRPFHFGGGGLGTGEWENSLSLSSLPATWLKQVRNEKSFIHSYGIFFSRGFTLSRASVFLVLYPEVLDLIGYL